MSKSMLDDFLYERINKQGQIHTHTKIGEKPKKGEKTEFNGGSFHIQENDNEKFLDLYYKKVFKEGKMEYLTEKQLIEDGPVLIDIDLNYDTNIKERQHTNDHILDFIMLYVEKLTDIVDIEDGSKLEVFCMEKTSVNCLPEKTKDGIHIIICLKMHKGVQMFVRDEVLKELPELWDDLPVINKWDDVFDASVTTGNSNWQMYGSRKPRHDAYLVKMIYEITYDSEVWGVDNKDISKFNTKENLYKLSARNNKHDTFELKEDYRYLLENIPKSKAKKKFIMKPSKKDITFNDISSPEILDTLLQEQFETFENNSCEYKLKETHDYVMALPEQYYGPGSFTKWIRVGWALANTNKKLFLTWLKFSSQEICRDSLKTNSGKFDWSNVSELYETWCSFENGNPDNLTSRSIMYWCKCDAYHKYMEIRKTTIDYFIEQTIQCDKPTEYDIAMVLLNRFKDQFVCVSIKNNFWYEYKGNKWFENDSGNSLRLSISKDLFQIYFDAMIEMNNKLDSTDTNDPYHEKLVKKIHRISTICQHVKTTGWKNNIMREAREVFYDSEFLNKLDQNPYLMCFNNYVVDFKEKIYRKGQPEDYISMSTKLDYIPYDKIKPNKKYLVDEIKDFIKQLFPKEELTKYMWEHLASSLIGTNDNQTFNIYTGSGANGKSRLVELMSMCLGDYKGTVPVTLITQSRTSIGSTSSEIVALKGKRYAVMQEPSKGDKINEGIMKEITGGDPIQGRALFKDTVTFIPQFKLVVCTNTLFDIKSNDDGTWRRIRVCPFDSKFIKNPYEDEKYPKEDYPFQYDLDKNLAQKFMNWGPIFMSLLVKHAFEKDGAVDDCDIVMSVSKEYRDGQDYLSEFTKDKIKKDMGSKVKKSELHYVFKEWYTSHYGRGVPKVKELNEFMDKKYGMYKSGWQNITIIHDDDDDDINEVGTQP